jgi:PHP family Zn ribbon phosphoesterase
VRSILADLHIHTALSPCASKEMTPPAIVREALRKGVQMIAICDHNTAGNVGTTQKAAVGYLTVIAGIEITTIEEVHVLGLFPSLEEASSTAREVLNTLPDAGRDETQPFLDDIGRITGWEEKMLYGSSSFMLDETVQLIKRHSGLAIASHVDRQAFSVIGQLGFFPDNVEFDAIEVSPAGVAARKHEYFMSLDKPIITASDSHYIDDIGSSCTRLAILEPSYTELAGAIHGIEGRRCQIA